MKTLNIIVSGGGTAGHIYPALAVAQELKNRGHNILFVGAKGKMEMQKVPQAGFRIIGLPVVGLQRKSILKNISVVAKMALSVLKARSIVKRFKPDVVVGFGGYASAPIIKAAQSCKIKTIIQEQNSYAGVANKMLAKEAAAICCAYQGMEKFFDKDKIVITGNPLRIVPQNRPELKSEAINFFKMARGKKTILVTGGSLGTKTLNSAMIELLKQELPNDVQILWQTGSIYQAEIEKTVGKRDELVNGVKWVPFIDRMDLAYQMADLVVCRAGAGTISEMQLLGKPAIFVPSPNVAEDHQTKNAMKLVEADAAVIVKDCDAAEKLFEVAFELLKNETELKKLACNIAKMAKPNAVNDIAAIIEGVMNVEKNVFFVGIGGIGMSALARFFKNNGYNVAGYDLTETKLTQNLVNEGIECFYDDNVKSIPDKFKEIQSTKVIFTPAVPKDNQVLNFFLNNKFEVIKRSQALGILCNDKKLFAVAGTHGKTTTSSMAAHFLVSTTGDGNAFLGGIAKNFNSNIVIGNNDNIVVEADEFDRSFWQLTPNAAVVTAIDPDHLDIYGSEEEFKFGFQKFLDKVKIDGKIILKNSLDITIDRKDVALFTYSLDDKKTDYHAINLNCNKAGEYEFDLVTPSRTIEGCRLGVPGLINVENCIAAVALIDEEVIDKAKFRNAISSYRGVARRFDIWINTPKVVYMDDYAHHPDELEAMLGSVKKMFPNRKITIVFQPHLYSRTRDFATQFAKSLSLADHVILLPIYPARELPIEGVTSKIILDNVTAPIKEIVEKEELNGRIENIDFDILITAGAGNIDQHCKKIAEIVNNRVEKKY